MRKIRACIMRISLWQLCLIVSFFDARYVLFRGPDIGSSTCDMELE